MKLKTIAPILLFVFLLCPTVFAGENDVETVEGILSQIKPNQEGNTHVQLGTDWYPISNNSNIYVCGTKQKQKNVTDLDTFIEYRIQLSLSAAGTYHEIHILCE